MKKIFLCALAALMMTACEKGGGDTPGPGDKSPTAHSGKLGTLTWALTENGTLTISGKGGMPNLQKEAYPWYAYRDAVKSVVTGGEVANIGYVAFYGYTNLESVTLTEGLTAIGYSAFYDCRSLSDINIPESVITIEDRAFYDCYALRDIVIPNAGITAISQELFSGCSGLTSITIPEDVSSIGYRAFYECTALMNVTVMATTPPNMNYYSYNFEIDGDTLHVPKGCLEAYKASSWNSAFSYIVEQQ